MPVKSTSFHVGNYEVSATFSGTQDPSILRSVRQILLSSVIGTENHSSGDSLAYSAKMLYSVGGDQHHAP